MPVSSLKPPPHKKCFKKSLRCLGGIMKKRGIREIWNIKKGTARENNA